ncbi:MAG: hypothetical protein PHW34_08500 [Hespellia sp.]|nr:hypothetical protein [Hespellia sp.]
MGNTDDKKQKIEKKEEYERASRILEKEREDLQEYENNVNRYMEALVWNWKGNQRICQQLSESCQFLKETSILRENTLEEEKDRIKQETRKLQREIEQQYQ